MAGRPVTSVLVTGAAGFMGKNLAAALKRRDDVALTTFSRTNGPEVLADALAEADVVFHLAGVNRPETDDEFLAGNLGPVEALVDQLKRHGRTPTIVMASSVQAGFDNPYGRSKKAAEDLLAQFGQESAARVFIYRLPNVFGKWSRPNYNSVVATFCHNIAHDLEIEIHDQDRSIELVYIDDVVAEFLRYLGPVGNTAPERPTVPRTFQVTLGELADRIGTIHDSRSTLVIPDLADDFTRCLAATYLSFLPDRDFTRPATMRTDDRGWLFELIKSEHSGQIFVSTTRPGITRGDHYHDTKVEKFCLIKGSGLIRFRAIDSDEILEYPVNDETIEIVDIPPGYTHSIENVGSEEMIVLFWANEIFDPERPDTHFVKVLQ